MTKQKMGGLALYALMLVMLIMNPGSTLASVILWIFLALAVIHSIEFIMVFGVLRKAGGSMFNHFVQTFLFGFMHWKPIKQQLQ